MQLQIQWGLQPGVGCRAARAGEDSVMVGGNIMERATSAVELHRHLPCSQKATPGASSRPL